ncbi:MAG: type IVB secretion system protein IcmH/DotU [Hydrogenimonas sp.]|nr:type IVB secretion system protein IcmH/DotU [Hydrogenimonas sp.]
MTDDKNHIVVYPDDTEMDNLFFDPPPSFISEKRGQIDDFDYSVGKSQPFLQILRLLYKEVYLIESGIKQRDILAVKSGLTAIMDRSMKRLSELDYENTDIMIVRYLLSTFVDEKLGSLEWPGDETWANHSLLGHYYQETYGGEKFFQILAHFVKDPQKYFEHMKLIYVILSLGYKGRYSISNHTDIKIESIRQQLYERIKNQEKEREKFYKEHPVSQIKHKLTMLVPYKFMFIGAFLILIAVYGVFTTIVIDNEQGLIDTLTSRSTAVERPDIAQE